MEGRRKSSIPIARPTLVDGSLDALAEVLESGWLSQGQRVREFEQSVERFTGAPHAVAVSSCTAGLHLSLLINGIGIGDMVLCPSYSFIATANAIRHAGAEPHFIDIDCSTFNVDSESIRKAIELDFDESLRSRRSGRHLKAIMLVHQFGLPADIDRIVEVASEYGLIVIEDSACALGSTYKSSPIGASGNTGVLSFHPRKVVTTGEGGMMLLHSDILADRVRVLREHGASTSPFSRSGVNSAESYLEVGFNYRMTDLQGALGVVQMEQLPYFLERRHFIAAEYGRRFSECSSIVVPRMPDYVTGFNYQSYALMLANSNAYVRDSLIEDLSRMGIGAKRGIPPIHKQEAYGLDIDLPNTNLAADCSFLLPIFPSMSDEDVEFVCTSVLNAVSRFARV